MGLSVTDVGLEKSDTHEIKKHAATIHCSNTLSLLQRKITNALLYHAYKDLMLKEEHEITIKHLCKLISYQGHNHAAIKVALKGLLSTVIEWNVVNDTTGLEDWTASSMLASVSLQGPLCYYAYSPRMKQLLYLPSMFGKINLAVQSRFKSSYGLALYENCIRYRGLPYTKWFDLEIFRKLMGVPLDKYTVFRDFKRRVLDKSIEEVNTYSELNVDVEIFREGRAVTKIRFSLKDQAKKIRLGSVMAVTETDSHAGLINTLANQFGLSAEQAQQVLKEYSADFIMDKVALIESSTNYQRGKVHNLAAYFLSALKHNYQPNKTTADVVAQKVKQDETEKQWHREIQQIQTAYTAFKDKWLDHMIASLNATEHAALLTRFRNFAAESIQTVLKLQRQKYTPDTVLDSPQIKQQLRKFVLQEMPDLSANLPTIEKFIETLPSDQQAVWHRFHNPH